MNFNRRDLLKIFGAGAVVAPVVNGLTDESTRARIIEPPKLELVEAPKLIEATDLAGVGVGEFDAVIYMTRRDNQKTIRWDVTVSAFDLHPLSLKYQNKVFTIRDKKNRRVCDRPELGGGRCFTLSDEQDRMAIRNGGSIEVPRDGSWKD